MTRVEPWVRKMTEDVMGGSPVEIGKCYQHPSDGVIKIISGQFWGEYGLSNFWYWTVLDTGKTHHGYAGQWPEVSL